MRNPTLSISLSIRPKVLTARITPSRLQHSANNLQWPPRTWDGEEISGASTESFLLSDEEEEDEHYRSLSFVDEVKKRLAEVTFSVGSELEDAVSAVMEEGKGGILNQLPKYRRCRAKKYARLALEYLNELAERDENMYERMRRMQMVEMRACAVTHLREHGQHAPGWDGRERWREGLNDVAGYDVTGETFPEGRMERLELERVKDEIIEDMVKQEMDEEHDDEDEEYLDCGLLESEESEEQYPSSTDMTDLDEEYPNSDESAM